MSLASDTRYAEPWQGTANGWVFRVSMDVWSHLRHSLSETFVVIFVVVIFFCSFMCLLVLCSAGSGSGRLALLSVNRFYKQRDGRPPRRRRTARLWLLLVILAGGLCGETGSSSVLVEYYPSAVQFSGLPNQRSHSVPLGH